MQKKRNLKKEERETDIKPERRKFSKVHFYNKKKKKKKGTAELQNVSQIYQVHDKNTDFV